MEENTLTWISSTIFYITLFFLLFIISKQFLKFRFKKIDIDNELTQKDNVSFSVLTTGYFIGILIVFCGVIQGESYGYFYDFITITFYGLIGNLFLMFGAKLNEQIVFVKKLNLKKEIIKDENLGTGFIEAANFIGTALIIYGAVNGKTINIFPQLEEIGYFISGFISLAILWILGQLILYLFLKLYTKICNYNVFDAIEKDNNAVGIVYSSVFIAISFLYSQAIKGDITSWLLTIENIAYYLGLGLILLPISRWIVDKIILPKSDLTYEIAHQEIPNQGAALIEGFAYIGSAVLISYCI